MSYTKSIDERFPYRGDNGFLGCCRARVFVADGQPPVVLVSELDDNPGPSITNAAEVLYPGIVARYLPGWLDQAEAVTFIEHYPGLMDGQGRRSAHTFDQVRFRDLRPVLVYKRDFRYVTFAGPWWRPLTDGAVARLIGEDELDGYGDRRHEWSGDPVGE